MSEGEQSEQQQQSTIDEYELKSQITNGNASQIWEVVAPGISTPLAMKLLLPEPAQKTAELNILKHEFKVGDSLDHPNCLRFLKVVASKGKAYIIMDYFRSSNLKVQIAKELPDLQSRIRKLIEGVCLSLGYMHEKGWVHRDIKPDNLLMSKSSEMRLIDFSLSTKRVSGFAKLLSGGKLKTIQGTRTYIAPETILKKHPTPQTDIYSFGITLYEILTGTPPFSGTSPNDLLKKHISTKAAPPSSANPNVTAEMDKFVAHLIAKKPESRPKDMNEVMAEFRSVKVFNEEPLEMLARLKEEAAKAAEAASSIDSRLDSRSDAVRKNKVITKGEKKAGQGAVKSEAPPEKKQPAAAPGQAPAQVPQQPMQPGSAQQHPGMMPQPMAHQMPQQPMHPGQMPQQPMMQPGMMPQQPMMQPGMMPQQPMMHPGQMPQQPAMHPGQMPQQPVMQPGQMAQQFQQAPAQPMPAHPQQQHPTQPHQQPPAQQQPAVSPPQPAEATQQPATLKQPEPVDSNPAPTAAAPTQSVEPEQTPEAADDIPLMTELPDIS